MSGPHKIVLACDETGAKGYADRDEAYPGEVGVFAGILMLDEVSAEKFPAFQALIDKYKPATGKLHIADLSDDKKEELRADVYGLIPRSALPCFWYAIHVAGLNRQFNEAQGAQKEALDAVVNAREGEEPRVKRCLTQFW